MGCFTVHTVRFREVLVVAWLSGALMLTGCSTPAGPDVSPSAKHDVPPSAKHKVLPSAKQEALLRLINVREAWKTTKGDPNVLVGVIDNGFDFFHPNLKGQLIPGFYYPGGYHTEFFEGIAHGTMMSSIIVARQGDRMGMVGLAPDCRVLTASQGMIEHTLIKLLGEFHAKHPDASFREVQRRVFGKHRKSLESFGVKWVTYQTSGAAKAIRHLVDHGVKVINISGLFSRRMCPSPEVWQELEDAFALAVQKDVVIVLAAGNSASKIEDYPGNPSSTIVAGATLLNDTRWEQEMTVRGQTVKQGSAFGKRLTVMAPTENIVVCLPHDKRIYTSEDGPMGATKVKFPGMHQVMPNGATSSAAPIVTSLVALVRSVRPDLDAEEVVELVKQGCDDIGEEGPDIHTGHGRVNFGKTIKAALSVPKE